MSVLGYSRSKRSYVGLRASAMALALVSARYPQPSRMIRMRGLGLAIFHHGNAKTGRRHDNESIEIRAVFQTGMRSFRAYAVVDPATGGCHSWVENTCSRSLELTALVSESSQGRIVESALRCNREGVRPGGFR